MASILFQFECDICALQVAPAYVILDSMYILYIFIFALNGIGLLQCRIRYNAALVFLALFAMSIMCELNFRWLSIVTPKYLVLLFQAISVLLIFICYDCFSFSFLPKHTATILLALRDSFHSFSQGITVSIWCCSLIVACRRLMLVVYNIVSSANMLILASDIVGISLM